MFIELKDIQILERDIHSFIFNHIFDSIYNNYEIYKKLKITETSFYYKLKSKTKCPNDKVLKSLIHTFRIMSIIITSKQTLESMLEFVLEIQKKQQF